MREVAADATFSLNRSVLIDEGSSRRQMAFGAHYELPSSRRQRILAKGAVRIVAVCTFDQPLFNLVMDRHRELWLDVAVALEAELGLLYLEQILRRAGCMQLTPPFPWAERSKLACLLPWHASHFLSTSLAVAVTGLKIMVTAPPSACAFPGP